MLATEMMVQRWGRRTSSSAGSAQGMVGVAHAVATVSAHVCASMPAELAAKRGRRGHARSSSRLLLAQRMFEEAVEAHPVEGGHEAGRAAAAQALVALALH